MALQALRTPATSRLMRGTRQLRFFTSRPPRRFGNSQAVTIQNLRVKNKKYGTLLGRLTVQVSAIVAAMLLYHYTILSPLGRAVEELAEFAPEEEEEEEEDSALFIPFPLTTKEIIPPPYSRTDPEWEEFIKINKDKELIQHIRSSLVHHVLRATSDHGILVARFGKPVKINTQQLDLDYPLYPPPVYRQLGLLITDEVVAIAERERDPLAARFEERVLWPKPMVMGTWAVLSAVMSDMKSQILGALFSGEGLKTLDQPGLGSDPPPAIASATNKPNDVQKAIQAIRGQATRSPDDGPPPDTNSMASSDKASEKTISRRPVNSSSPSPAIGLPTAKDDKPRTPSGQTQLFWQAYSKAYKPFRANPPRGSVPVMGLVVVETQKAWLYIDVIGWWDPKEKGYHSDSLSMSLGRVRSKVIRALR